jgi:hypothetical protein
LLYKIVKSTDGNSIKRKFAWDGSLLIHAEKRWGHRYRCLDDADLREEIYKLD